MALVVKRAVEMEPMADTALMVLLLKSMPVMEKVIPLIIWLEELTLKDLQKKR